MNSINVELNTVKEIINFVLSFLLCKLYITWCGFTTMVTNSFILRYYQKMKG